MRNRKCALNGPSPRVLHLFGYVVRRANSALCQAVQIRSLFVDNKHKIHDSQRHHFWGKSKTVQRNALFVIKIVHGLKSKNIFPEFDHILSDVNGVQDVGVAPGETGGRRLNAGVFVDLFVNATPIVLNLKWFLFILKKD